MLPEAPAAIFPVSHDESDVTVAVCAVVSLLVQVTVSPTLAVMEAGLNAKLGIVAATGPAVLPPRHAAPPHPPAPPHQRAAPPPGPTRSGRLRSRGLPSMAPPMGRSTSTNRWSMRRRSAEGR